MKLETGTQPQLNKILEIKKGVYICFSNEALLPTLEELEQTVFVHAMMVYGNRLSWVAKALGISRQTVLAKCRKYGIPRPYMVRK
jgi:DNA-binding NtrC family response regulator